VTLKTDVLIVGAGPVGLITALLLERLDVDFLVVERRAGLHKAPQAHVISSRSMEICRLAGIDDGLIRAAGPNPMDTRNIRWVDKLVGKDLGVFSMVRDADQVRRMLTQSPTPTTNLSQDRFEQILFEHLRSRQAVRFEHAWVGCEPIEVGFASQIHAGSGDALEVVSRYVIGADGAGSGVRAAMGAGMVGPDNIQSFVNVHFSANMRQHLEGREGLLYWVMDGACDGVFIAHNIDSNWIFMKTAEPGDSLDPIDEDKYAALLRTAVGVDADLKINSMNAWRMTAQISDAYAKGGMFLVGDAAHRFPPTGGIGMNTGFQDAHNLVWKIGMVLAGYDDTLLETYEPERKPIAQTNSSQSLSNAMRMSEVAKLLDVSGDGRISRADLDAVFASIDRQADVQAAIDAQAPHFDMSGLDLGLCYSSKAVVSDGLPPQPTDPVSNYEPSTTPGARLPHAVLTRAGERISTLDLVVYDGLLVLAATDADSQLDTAVAELVRDGYPMQLVRVGDGQPVVPADEQFAALFPIGQVLLVRPDGHISARLEASSAAAQLAATVRKLLPRTIAKQ